jgi:alanine-alpha-ketoisovalerate/valine-pyruvate aminotransferase
LGNTKRRIVFTFDEDSFKRINELANKGNYSSKQPLADVLSDALNLMYKIRENYNRGFTYMTISTFNGNDKVGFYLPNLFERSAAQRENY